MRIFSLSAAVALLICFLPALLSKKADTKVVLSVYNWTHNYYNDVYEDSLLKRNNFERVYVKIMDIDWHPLFKAYPTTNLDLNYELSHNPNIEIVPVVFITNKTITNSDSSEIAVLAEKLFLKTNLLCDSLKIIHEIQIDCDWTKKSKAKYFYLLTLLNKKFTQQQLSATIRLHQYKYRESCGIPPVKRGMLMLYNMGKLADYNETNSIFNYKEALKYINGYGPYPISLDAALPCFNWAVAFQKKQFNQLVYGVSKEYLDTCKSFQKQENGYYKVSADYWNNEFSPYFRYGDELRLENVTSEDLIQAAKLINKIKNADTMRVSFFELNSSTLKSIDSLTYEKIRAIIK